MSLRCGTAPRKNVDVFSGPGPEYRGGLVKDTRWAMFDGAFGKPEFLDPGHGTGNHEPSRLLSSNRRRFNAGRGGWQDQRAGALHPMGAAGDGSGLPDIHGGRRGHSGLQQPDFKSQGMDFKGGEFGSIYDTQPLDKSKVAELGGDKRFGRNFTGQFSTNPNQLGHGKGGTFGGLKPLGGGGDGSSGGALSGDPRDKSHRVRHGAGFNTTGGKRGGKGLFSSYGYMPEGSADPYMDANKRSGGRRSAGGRAVLTGKNGNAKGTFGKHPSHMADPYVEAPGRYGRWYKGALYTFTSRYERSARPHTSGVGRVQGRTLAQTKVYSTRRALEGHTAHGGSRALGNSMHLTGGSAR